MDNINKICDEIFYEEDKSVFILRGDKCNPIQIIDTFHTDYASITEIPTILLSEKELPIENYMEIINVKLLCTNYFYIHAPTLDKLSTWKIKELVSGETFALAESLLDMPDRNYIKRKLLIFIYSGDHEFIDNAMNKRSKYIAL